jgi:putative lipoprotein
MRKFVFGAAVFALAVASAFPVLAERITLQGDVTYRERIALPEGGKLSVSLIDLAAPERPGLTATGPIASPGKVPLTFVLNLETEKLDPTHQYALAVKILDADGTVWFRNEEPYAVNPLAPAEPIQIVVNSQGIVDEQELPRGTVNPPFLNVTWTARTIAGKPTARGAVSSLSIGKDMRAGGRGGCNNWFAQAKIEETMLAFSAVAATRMACPNDEITAQESAFFDALARTRYWRLRNDQLSLVDGNGAELAVLEKSRF